MPNAIQFFATNPDLTKLFEQLDTKLSLQFTRAGRFDSITPSVFLRFKDIPNVGIASHASAVACDAYLVSLNGVNIRPRTLASAPLYVFDQLHNPKTVVFQPGGLWKNEILIRGSVGTASNDPEALRLMRIFSAAFKNQFAKIKGIFVGKEAQKIWKEGKRLTGAEQSPAEFDLAPP